MNKLIASLIFFAVLSGCTVAPIPAQQMSSGTIIGLRSYKVQEKQSSGLGAVAGASVGGVLVHQVGKGNGKNLATIAGALAGTVLGSNLSNSQVTLLMLELTIQENNNNLMTMNQPETTHFYVGQRVNIIKRGNLAQAIPY